MKNEYFLLSIMLLLGFVVRLYRIDNPVADWHSWRQADTAAVSRNFVNGGINMLYPTYDDISSIQSGLENPTGIRMVEFPIYNLLSFATAKISNLNVELSSRLTSIILSLIDSSISFILN